MNQPASTRGYDLFKLVVAIILLVLLIWLMLRRSQNQAASGVMPSQTPLQVAVQPTQAITAALTEVVEPSITAVLIATETVAATPTVVAAATLTQGAPATSTQALATSAPAQPATATFLPTVTPPLAETVTATSTSPAAAQAASPTPTSSPTSEATPTTEATTVPEATPAPTAIAGVTPTGQAAVACDLALPTRLQVGDQARVTSNLNMRDSPSITGQLILTNPTGTQLEITGGPVCEPYRNRAYLWWEVRNPAGQTGWSAEGALNLNFYFLEPVNP